MIQEIHLLLIKTFFKKRLPSHPPKSKKILFNIKKNSLHVVLMNLDSYQQKSYLKVNNFKKPA